MQKKVSKIDNWVSFMRWERFTLAVLGLSLLAGLFFAVDYIGKTDDVLEAHPKVFTLDSTIRSTRVSIGPSPICGHIECFLLTDFDDSHWMSVQLPKYNIAEHPSFDRAVRDGLPAYYRVRVNVPEQLMALEEGIAYSSKYITFKSYQVYLNGHVVASSGPEAVSYDTLSIHIPKEAYIDGSFVLVFKGYLEKASGGLAHKARDFLGERAQIDKVFVSKERSLVTHSLMFLLSKGAVLLVFVLLYLLTRPQAFLRGFFVYAFFTTFAEIFVSQFLDDHMSIFWRAPLYFCSQIVGYSALLQIVKKIYGIKLQNRSIVAFAVLMMIVVLSMLFDFYWGTRSVNYYTIYQFMDAFYVATLSIALVIAGYGLWRTNNYRVLFFGLIAYSLFILAEIYFETFRGLSKRPLFDLFFYYLVAFIVIKEFGKNQEILEEQKETIRIQSRNAAIGEMSSMLAHDLRKPFNQVRLLLEIIKSGKQSQDWIDEASATVSNSMQQVNSMIDSVLSVQRSEAYALRPTSLKSVVENAIAQVAPLCSNSQIHYKVELMAKMQPLADEYRLTNALGNILSNAIEAIGQESGKKTGRIWIKSRKSFWKSSPAIELTIGNNGPLIPEESLKRVFDILFTSGKPMGTGLGLASVKQTIDLHKGKIEVANSIDPEGVEFKITLCESDVNEPSTQEVYNAEKASIEKESLVIVVDDDPLVRSAWTSGEVGARVKAYSSPKEFWEKFDPESAVACIVTDCNFSGSTGEDGRDFAKELKSKMKVPVFASSGYSQDEMGEAVKYLDAVLEKRVFSWNELKSLIDQT
jgi:signal transduction histidine kinase/CheY-like chemotaxis protein